MTQAPETYQRAMSDAAELASASVEDLTGAAEAAIANSRELIAELTSAPVAAGTSGADALVLLDTYDEAVAELSNVLALAHMVGKCSPDPAMREAADRAEQELSREVTAISLHPAVYAALNALDVSDQDAATRHYLAKTLRSMRRAGVDRDEATRARIRELEDEILTIGQAFDRNIREDTRVAVLPAAALDGLPDDYVRAHQPDADGNVTISTDYPDIIPFTTYARDESAREQLWRLFRQRAHPANVDVFAQLLARRHELANLLGYPTWAQYITEDKMIGSERAAADFIDRISELAADRCARDYADLLARKRRDDPAAERVMPWDATYLEDRLKAETLAFDTRTVRPYFEYTAVKDGLIGLVERMFGIAFVRRDDIPVWHPDVEAYDVVGAGDQAARGLLGRAFLDMHPRAGKYNHAAMFTMCAGKAGRRIPEGALLCNLPKPGDEPALLQHSDVTVFFHEFGHLVHEIIGGHQRWSGISGVSSEWDFVEAPSQMLEEWTFDAATLAGFARHVDTGEPLPAGMVARLREAAEFGKGLLVRQQMFYAALSLNLYRGDPAGIDPVEVERTAMARHTPFTPVDGTYMHLSFGHLDGYSAMYYTYMWSLVIAKDLFTRFAAEGLPAPAACLAYRDTVLAAGGSAPAAEMVHDFLGREYTFEAYKAWLDS